MLTSERIRKNCPLAVALAVLPPRVRSALLRAVGTQYLGEERLSEIRLRLFGRSGIVISGRNIPLFIRLTDNDMRYIIEAATGGSVYSQEENLKNGFVSLGCGVRMGVCLSASLELPTSVAIRLPLGECDNAELVYSGYKAALPRGIVIYSPPGVGKTTALRSLARIVGERDGRRVVVVDERGEFDLSLFPASAVDIISGHTKARGIEIAKRTLGAELIIADEIGGGEECEALISVGRGGVPFAVSAHASGIDELLSSHAVSRLAEMGYFGAAIGLSRSGGKIKAVVDKL